MIRIIIWLMIRIIIWILIALLICSITLGTCVHVYKHYSAHCWVSGSDGCPGIDVSSNTIAYIWILIRLLTVGPLSANMDNLSFAPRRNYGFYEDFVDGERLKRIYDALRPGASALTSVLFFDSINRDKKGTYCVMSFLMAVLMYVDMYVDMYVVMYTVSNCSPSARVL